MLGDGAGNAVHFFERDCSIQRRHQKIVEESPCPHDGELDDTIAKMAQVSVDATCALKYQGAGTFEYLLSEDGDFYFLEMNTRLQVEHPVTEAITRMESCS